MKYIIFTFFLIISSQSYAVESPYDKFSAKSNFTNQTTVEWVQVDNVRIGCDKESKSRGLPGYPKPVEACSFWNKTLFGGNTCLIITPKHVQYWTFGHELRHCFQGRFHND